MLRPAGEARQDQKWRVGIMSHLFGRIRRYYALRTSHDVVVAYSCQQLQGVRGTLLCGMEGARCGLLGSPGNRSREAAGVNKLRCICDGYARRESCRQRRQGSTDLWSQSQLAINRATHSSRRVEGQIARSGRIVANPDRTHFGVTSELPVTRPELWIAASRRSMSALAIIALIEMLHEYGSAVYFSIETVPMDSEQETCYLLWYVQRSRDG
jgi:hypothetical protein